MQWLTKESKSILNRSMFEIAGDAMKEGVVIFSSSFLLETKLLCSNLFLKLLQQVRERRIQLPCPHYKKKMAKIIYKNMESYSGHTTEYLWATYTLASCNMFLRNVLKMLSLKLVKCILTIHPIYWLEWKQIYIKSYTMLLHHTYIIKILCADKLTKWIEMASN